MNFTHLRRPAFPIADQVNSKNGRTYTTIKGKSYPSITTILSHTKDKSGLVGWRKRIGNNLADFIMKNATDIGTETHRLIESCLNNNEPNTMYLMAEAHLRNLSPFLKNIDNIYGNELALFSDKYEMAGMCDCIAEYQGVLSIIDFKTSRKVKKEEWIEDYFLQTTAYSIMWEELTGIPINQVVILISSEDNVVASYVKDVKDYKEGLLDRLKEYSVKGQSL
jgi:hypothetical protein